MSEVLSNNPQSRKRFKFNLWKKVWHSILGTVTEGYLKVTYCDGSVVFCGKSSNSDSYAELIIHDGAFYSRAILGGSVGLGDAYVDGFGRALIYLNY